MEDSQQPTAHPFFFKAPPLGYYVEGNELVVRDGAVLPAVCVKTNQPVPTDDLAKEEFTWCTPWIGLLFVISGPLLILLYFLIRKRFALTYGLHPDYRKQRRKRTMIKSLVAVVLFLTMPFLAAIDNMVLIAIAVIALIVAVITIFVGNSPLSVTKHSEGRFWVKGFSPEFLARLEGAT